MNNKYSIENKIIPLFNVPITMKKLFDIKTNKYNNDLNKSEPSSSVSGINNKNRVKLYSKVLEKYNSNLNIINKVEELNSFHTSSAQVLNNNPIVETRKELIEEIKEDNNYNINNIYKNYLHLINRYLPYFVYFNSFFKLGLFLPTQLFKPQFYSNKYKKLYFPVSTVEVQTVNRDNAKISNKKSILQKKKAAAKIFIRLSSLKKILLGNLSLLILKNKGANASLKKKTRGNLVKNFFNLNKNVCADALLLENNVHKNNIKTAHSTMTMGVSSISKKNNIKNIILLDNNFLPLNSLKSAHITSQKDISVISSASHSAGYPYGTGAVQQSKEVVRINLLNIIEKGDSIINELNSLILEKQNLINNNKVNNLFSTLHSDVFVGRECAGATSLNINTNSSTLMSPALAPTQSNNEEVIITNEAGAGAAIDLKNNLFLEECSKNEQPLINQYLKSMSIYNMKKKGILIHYNILVDYNFVKGSLGFVNKLIFKVYKLLQASFKSMYCLISKPIFIITPDKITIRLFYFLFVPNILKYKKLIANKAYKGKNKKKRLVLAKKQYNKFRKLKKNVRVKLRNLSNFALNTVFHNKFKLLSLILSKLFKKPVEFDLTRLHYPYNDSNILVNLLGIMINKIKLRIIIRRLFEKAVIKNLNKLPLSASAKTQKENNINWKDCVNIPAFLSGIKIKVGGRLLTQSVVPRQTVKITQRGATQRGKINFLDVARYTRKNKRGAFSITIKSGQNIF